MSPEATALGWGLIGASTIASEYMVDAIRADPGSHVVAVASGSRQRAATFAQAHNIPTAYSSHGLLLANAAIAAVYVSSRNDEHLQATVAAAAAGHHVLCEKPLSVEVDQARDMVAACARAGVVLAVDHHFRSTVLAQKVRALVADGAIGTPTDLRLFHPVLLPEQLRTWRLNDPRGGGVSLDLTVHDADLVRYLLDDDIVSVQATSAHREGPESGLPESDIAVLARTARGTTCTLHDTFVAHHAPSTLDIHGTDGSLLAVDVMQEDRCGELHLVRDGRASPIPLGPYSNPYERTVRHFHLAIERKGAPIATGTDGVLSLQVATAAREAAMTGSTIEVPTLVMDRNVP